MAVCARRLPASRICLQCRQGSLCHCVALPSWTSVFVACALTDVTFSWEVKSLLQMCARTPLASNVFSRSALTARRAHTVDVKGKLVNSKKTCQSCSMVLVVARTMLVWQQIQWRRSVGCRDDALDRRSAPSPQEEP